MKSIKTKLILTFSILAILISAFLGAFGTMEAIKSITKEAEHGLISTVTQAAGYVKTEWKQTKQF